MRELWPHQIDAIQSLRQSVGQGVRRIVLQSPTGSGKTLLAASIVDSAIKKGKRVTFCCSHLSLIDQTVEGFYREGIVDVGVFQGNHHMMNFSKPVQIASIQTINARKLFPQSDIVIIDECHVLFDAHKRWLADESYAPRYDADGKRMNPGVVFIGMSATPYTKGLGRHFDTLLTVATTQELIAKGILCPPRVFSCGHPDLKRRLKAVKVVAGDYQENQLSAAMNDKELTGDVVRTWVERWGKDKTLCYGVDRVHAQALQARFVEAGVRCGYQDGETPGDERRDIKRKFHSGELQVVCSVGTMTTGIDWDVRCQSIARPTQSRMLFKQIVGRALRTAKDKLYATIFDHGRVVQELGFPTEIECMELDKGGTEKVRKPIIRYAKECPSCHQFRSPGKRACDNCGFEPTPQSPWIETADELQEVDRATLPKKQSRQYSMQEKMLFLAELKSYAATHGYKPGWAARKYRDKMGVWPDASIEDCAARTPGAATLSWIRAMNIAWSKSKNNPRNTATATAV